MNVVAAAAAGEQPLGQARLKYNNINNIIIRAIGLDSRKEFHGGRKPVVPSQYIGTRV